MEEENKKPADELEGDTLESPGKPTAGTVIDPRKPTPEVPKPQAEEKKSNDRGSLFDRLPFSKNIYLVAFMVLVALAAAVVFASLRWGRSNDGSETASQRLTTEQLAALAGNSTLVGDPKQTLAIQGNTIFEGQVLARNDFEVAGSLKVGGPLSLPSLSAGDASLEQLSVTGDSVLQGRLTVQGGISVSGATSFANLSASQLNVSNLQLTGDLTISRHIAPGGGVPGKSNGSALGGGGTASVSGGDTAGTISINTGGGPPAGCFITVNFVQKFNTTPRVVVSPSNSSSAGLNYYTNRSSTNFSLCTANAPAAGTTYLFDYIVFD